MLLEPYGYRWFRVGGLGYLLSAARSDGPQRLQQSGPGLIRSHQAADACAKTARRGGLVPAFCFHLVRHSRVLRLNHVARMLQRTSHCPAATSLRKAAPRQ
jgi:hypothetical protein